MAIIAAITNSNSVMYSILAKQYGVPTDVGAVSYTHLKSSAAVKTAAAKALAHARGEEYVEEKPAGFVTPDHMADGTYKYEQGFDDSGYNNIVTLEIKNGKVAACSWDALNQDGVYKSQLCMNGEMCIRDSTCDT